MLFFRFICQVSQDPIPLLKNEGICSRITEYEHTGDDIILSCWWKTSKAVIRIFLYIYLESHVQVSLLILELGNWQFYIYQICYQYYVFPCVPQTIDLLHAYCPTYSLIQIELTTDIVITLLLHLILLIILLWTCLWFTFYIAQVARNLILAGHYVHVVTGAPEYVFTNVIQSPRLFIRKVRFFNSY